MVSKGAVPCDLFGLEISKSDWMYQILVICTGQLNGALNELVSVYVRTTVNQWE
jgi:hypothetical protein